MTTATHTRCLAVDVPVGADVAVSLPDRYDGLRPTDAATADTHTTVDAIETCEITHRGATMIRHLTWTTPLGPITVLPDELIDVLGQTR